MQESIMISVRNGPDDKLDLIYVGKRYTLRSWKLTKGGECHVQSVELDPTELKERVFYTRPAQVARRGSAEKNTDTIRLWRPRAMAYSYLSATIGSTREARRAGR